MEWRWFSLEQVNSVEGPEWKVWDEPPGFRSRSLLAFKAGEAARRQGPEAFERFLLALLRARHVERLPLDEQETIDRAAAESLDAARLRRDMQDPTLLRALKRDHEEALTLGVFGTPTLVFDNGGAAYLKMRPDPPDDEVMDVWRSLKALIADRPYITEVKRPKRPE